MRGLRSGYDAVRKSFRREEDAPLSPARQADEAGGWFLGAAIALSFLWAAGALAVVAALAPGGLAALTPVQGVALAFMALLPAGVLILGAMIAREGVRARAQARRLADAADRMMNPSPVADAAARRLGITVRGEIAALDRSMEEALSKLEAVDEVIRRQAAAVEKSTAVAQQGAGHMVSGLEREREALLKISEDLERRTSEIIAAIAKQSQGIASAADLATERLKVVDESMTARISSFGAAAALIGEKTEQLDRAAATTATGSTKLEAALVQALEALAQATSLTDAAKRNVENAAAAANATAGAVRDSTTKAVEDAKRVADLVRAEAQGLEREAQSALGALRDSAVEARSAAQEMRMAVGAPAPRVERMERSPSPLSSAPVTNARAFTFAPANERRENLQTRERREDSYDEGFGAETLRDRQPETPRGFFGFRARRAEAAKKPPTERWTWRDLFGGDHSERAPTQPEQPVYGVATAPNEFDRLHEPYADVATAPRDVNGAAVVAEAGVRLDEVFGIAALDRIASRARNGTQARRRAVRDAAPEVVARLAATLDADHHIRANAMAFLQEEGARMGELLGRGRASMSADITRAFLLLDATQD